MRDGWVVTQGEPHWRNVLADTPGLHVVDWDTARPAPPARDLWHATNGADPQRRDDALDRYAARTGRVVGVADLEARSLRWDLEEAALYVALFSRPHPDDEDSATAWSGFSEALASLASWAPTAERSGSAAHRPT